MDPKIHYAQHAPQQEHIGKWLSLRNKDILPALRFCRGFVPVERDAPWYHWYTDTPKNKLEIYDLPMDKTCPPFMDMTSEPKFDALFLKLPRELREMIFANILGPSGDENRCRHVRVWRDSCSPIGIAYKVSQPRSDKIINTLLLYAQDYIFSPYRDSVLAYLPDNQHEWLESCARRMGQMNHLVLEEFMSYYFRNLVLDFKYGTWNYHDQLSAGVRPDTGHHWLKLNTRYHPFIRNMSFDLGQCLWKFDFVGSFTCAPYLWNSEKHEQMLVLPFCRTISRILRLDTVILFIFLDRKEAEYFLAGQTPPTIWPERIEVIRQLNVSKPFEIHTAVGRDEGGALAWDEADSGRSWRELIAEFKQLDEILYPLLLPDTLRDPTVVNHLVEDDMGIAELLRSKRSIQWIWTCRTRTWSINPY